LIHPTALVDPKAECADDVQIGAYSIIGPNVKLGSGCNIGSHVVIKGPTEIGSGSAIYPFCSIGDDPQDKKFIAEGESKLVIGENNTIREYCSINRGTQKGGGITRLGNDNWIMAYCHIAHDCQIGNHVVFANNATLAGHVEIHDYAILGGFTGVHNTARARAINREGLRRRGFDSETISALKEAFKTIYKKGLILNDALETLAPRAAEIPQVDQLLKFIRLSQRGIVR